MPCYLQTRREILRTIRILSLIVRGSNWNNNVGNTLNNFDMQTIVVICGMHVSY